MAKVRVVLAEVEGTDEAVQSVLSQFIDQVTAAAVAPELPAPAEAPKPALISPPAIAEAPKPPRHNGHARPKTKPETKALEKRTSEKPPEPGATRTRILDALRKRPMTSGEVMKETGLPNSTVYSMLNILRGEGKVISKPDPGGIYPKQHLVE